MARRLEREEYSREREREYEREEREREEREEYEEREEREYEEYEREYEYEEREEEREYEREREEYEYERERELRREEYEREREELRREERREHEQIRREAMDEAFRRALSDGEADVAYCRVMLLGPAGVGKTSFKRGLMGESFTHNTNSTELADVQAVKPTVQVSRRWMTQDKMNKWCEVSEEDEIDELAKLMVIVENSLTQQPCKTQMPDQIVGLTSVSRFKRVEQLMESKVIQKALEKAKEIYKENHSLECQPFFHLWDCGGQPVFLEVIPIFLTSHTMFLLFFNAAKNLKEPWESVYRNDGREISEGLVNCNTLQMMERWMALVFLLQKDSGSEYQNVIQIGTRKDQLTQSEEDLQKELDEFFDGKIFIRILKKIVFVDNTTSGQNEDHSYEKVRKIISDFTSKYSLTNQKTPVSWVLLRKFLLLLVKEFGVNLITRDEADDIGLHCNVKSQDIPHVLRFYHELGVLLYYPQIEGLHDKIVLSPVWFVKCLGMILAPPSNTEDGLKNEWKLFRSLGILSERLYTHVWKECKGLNPESLIELLTHFQLAVKIECSIKETKGIRYDDHCPKYFVPAVLPYSPSSSPPDDSSLIKAAPLHITFNTTGFAIPGFFTRLSTTLLKVKNGTCPKLSLYFKDGVYHDMVKYRCLSLPTAFMTLTEQSNVIEIGFVCSSKLSPQEVHSHCIDLKDFVEDCCNEVQKNFLDMHPKIHRNTFSTELKVVCQDEKCKDKPTHYLTSQPHKLTESSPYTDECRIVIVCTENAKDVRLVTLQEAYWYRKIDKNRPEMNYSKSNEKVKLNEVFDLFKNESSEWDSIGRDIGVPPNFRNGLKREGVQSTDDNKLEQVLNKWIELEGEVSWKHLMEIRSKRQSSSKMHSIYADAEDLELCNYLSCIQQQNQSRSSSKWCTNGTVFAVLVILAAAVLYWYITEFDDKLKL